MNLVAARGPEITVFAITAVACLVVLGLMIWLVYGTMARALARVPPQYRLMSPGLAYLCLIPLFGIIWIYFVVSRTSRSLEGYYRAWHRHDVGDCGRGLGLAWAILTSCLVVPILNYLAWIPWLVCMILYLARINDLKNQIPTENTYQSVQDVF